MNGNWSQLDMTKDLHATATQASLALTAFWGMVTVGRVLFAMIERWFPPHLTYHVLRSPSATWPAHWCWARCSTPGAASR
jgi:hypothetical protein